MCDCLSTTCLLCGGLSASTPWLMTCDPRVMGTRRGIVNIREKKVDYSVQFGWVGLMVLSPAIWLPLPVFPTGQSLSGLWCSWCSWKCGLRHLVLHHIWESGYQHCHRSYSSKILAGDNIQFSVVLIGYVQFVAAFVVLLSLVEVYLVACCLCSTEYRPCVGG